jgi:hypothetical protein
LESTRGVYLVTAELVVDGKPSALNLVLKALARSDAGAMPREAELYRSGALSSLHGGLVAPRCFGVAQLPDGSVGVWLEHVEDAIGPVWPIARFALAAFHLGELAALDSGSAASLARRAPRRNYCALAGLIADNLDRLQRASDHPLVRRAYPPPVRDGLLALWRDRGPVLAALDRAPDTVCHGDAQRRNLFARRDGAGPETTVAVDWANFATAPVGMDVATLVHYGPVYFDADVADVAEVDRRSCDGYLAGLRAGGWRGEPKVVRFAYAMQLALGLGLCEIHPVLRLALDASRHAWAARRERTSIRQYSVASLPRSPDSAHAGTRGLPTPIRVSDNQGR